MYQLTRNDSYRERAEYCLDWLIENPSPGWEHYCWGNDFTFVTRNGRLPKYTPTIVWSSLIGHSFVFAYELFNESKYLDVASSVGEFILSLPREKTHSGTCISYVTFEQTSIHNSNMLGSGFLARLTQYRDNAKARELAREAMIYSCTRQLPDGAWYGRECSTNQWSDNSHTGYNLDRLHYYINATGDTTFDKHRTLGLTYMKEHFFEDDGRPKYFHNRTYPIDIQCASQAIDTLALFSDDDEALALSKKVADWTIDNMQDPEGFFYYRDLGWRKIKIPMFHWGQGTMFKALSHLLSRMA